MSDLEPERPERSLNLRDWRRLDQEKKIAGVAAGIAEQLGIPITLVRAAFVLSALYSGAGVIAYLVLWFLMPPESGGESGLDRLVASVSELTGDAPRRHREHRARRVQREHDLDDGDL